MTNMYLVSY